MSAQIVTGSIGSSRCSEALKATRMLALKVGRILVALKTTVDRNVNPHVDRIFVVRKATVDRNINSHCWQDFGSYESHGYRVKKLADLLEKERGGPKFFTAWRKHKWRKRKLLIALDSWQNIRVWKVLRQFVVISSVNSLLLNHYLVILSKLDSL